MTPASLRPPAPQERRPPVNPSTISPPDPAVNGRSAAAAARRHGKNYGACSGPGDGPREAAEKSRRGVARRAASARGCEERALREEALKPWVPAQSKAKRSLVYGFLLSVTDISVGEMYFTHPRVKAQTTRGPCSTSIPCLAANYRHTTSGPSSGFFARSEPKALLHVPSYYSLL